MTDSSIFKYFLPYQPWIFFGGVLLLAIVAAQSMVFLSPYGAALRSSTLWRIVRMCTASVLSVYASLALAAVAIFSVLVLLAGHGTYKDVTSFAGNVLLIAAGLICVIGLLLFWAFGSRVASALSLLVIFSASYYLITYRIASICEPLALAGSSRAQLCMAELSMYKSPGTHKKRYFSRHKTKDWYEMAAAGGNARAAYLMGVKKRDEALLRTAVEGGELRAAVPLAGKLSRDSRSEGIRWVMLAADEGIPDAMEYAGHLYLRGQEVEQDIPKAVDYIERAAQAEDLSAMWFMAIQHARGSSGLERDAELSREWERRALAREKELAEYEAELRSTYNFEVRPDVLHMKLARLQALNALAKARE